jgi:flagellar basal body-associated protein FliL
MIQTLLIIIAILLFLIALFLFFAVMQNSVFEHRVKALEDAKNPHNFSHPTSKIHPKFNKDEKAHKQVNLI